MGLPDSFSLPIIGICAAGSKMGKTTLLTRLLPILNSAGVRVSVVKHAHHRFDVDYPGKDSYLIREAGAVQTLVASDKRIALITERERLTERSDEVELAEVLSYVDISVADLVLVEGFKHARIPKIEVYRQTRALPLLSPHLEGVIAVVSDSPLDINLPVIEINHVAQLANFILTHFAFGCRVTDHAFFLPSLNEEP